MNDGRLDLIEELVEAALALSGGERARYLERGCRGDAELRAEVEDLLAGEGTRGPDFLEPPGAVVAKHTLGGFELLRELGRGGMGVVYLAHQGRLRREVAVKVLLAGLTTTERDIERFHREARATARLRHPGIIQVFADGQEEDTHWFAMEFVPGHDLQRELQLQKSAMADDRPFLPRPGEPEHVARIARLCADVADALQCAHGHGLVHRDVKPQNLLLQDDGRVQVGDFGLVRDEALNSITHTGELAGTLHYMSPEQAGVLRAAVDARTDVYSLGVVLYELATHRRPFEGKTSVDVLSKIRDTHPRSLRSLNPRIPRDLETICLKAMAKDPRDRYATAADLRDDLRRFLAHEAILAKPPHWLALAGRWMRRHRHKVAAAVLLTGGIVGGALVASRVAARDRHAHLGVEARDAAGEPLAASVGLRSIDRFTGAVGPLVPLGQVPVAADVEPGYYRVVLELGGGEVRVFSRNLEPSVETRINGRVRAPASTEGMVWIPGGVLAVRDPDERFLPTVSGRDIEIAGFYLDKFEVTNAEYRRFLEDTSRKPPSHWEDVRAGEDDDKPIAMVTYLDALAYAEWAGKRLPSFPEWLWAARGSENRIYPWPNAVKGTYLGNVSRSEPLTYHKSIQYYRDNVEPVDAHPDAATASGLFNMLGNVAEWTESFQVERQEEQLAPNSATRLIAGHNWHCGVRGADLTSNAHWTIGPQYVEYTLGFRCALSADP